MAICRSSRCDLFMLWKSATTLTGQTIRERVAMHISRREVLAGLPLTCLAIGCRPAAWHASAEEPEPARAAQSKPNTVVAADGSGDHRTVQAAINAVPTRRAGRFVIQIEPGIYKEKLV